MCVHDSNVSMKCVLCQSNVKIISQKDGVSEQTSASLLTLIDLFTDCYLIIHYSVVVISFLLNDLLTMTYHFSHCPEERCESLMTHND